jgi:hypothetical protein
VTIPPEGLYVGKVRDAFIEEGYKAGELVAVFLVDVEALGKTETVRQDCQGEYVGILKKTCELFELPWPAGLQTLAMSVGHECEIKIKHREPGKKGPEYRAYINVQKDRARASEGAIAAAVAKLGAVAVDDSDIPF